MVRAKHGQSSSGRQKQKPPEALPPGAIRSPPGCSSRTPSTAVDFSCGCAPARPARSKRCSGITPTANRPSGSRPTSARLSQLSSAPCRDSSKHPVRSCNSQQSRKLSSRVIRGCNRHGTAGPIIPAVTADTSSSSHRARSAEMPRDAQRGNLLGFFVAQGGGSGCKREPRGEKTACRPIHTICPCGQTPSRLT